MNSENIKTCDVCYNEIYEKKEFIDEICQIHYNQLCLECILEIIINIGSGKFVCPLCRKKGKTINVKIFEKNFKKTQDELLKKYCFNTPCYTLNNYFVFDNEDEIYEILNKNFKVKVDEKFNMIQNCDRVKYEILKAVVNYINDNNIDIYEKLGCFIKKLNLFNVKKLLILENDNLLNYICDSLKANIFIKTARIIKNKKKDIVEVKEISKIYNNLKNNYNKLIN